MKSNRILWLVLAGIIIIVLAGAGIIYAADSREVNKREELNDSIAKNQATLTQGLAAKEAKKAEAIELEQRLAEARQLLEETGFCSRLPIVADYR
jgi:hypothetical protein